MRLAIFLLGLGSAAPLACPRDDGDLLFRVVDAHSGEGIPRARVYDVTETGSVLRQYWPIAGNSPAIGLAAASGVVRATSWFGGFPDRRAVLLTAEGFESAVIELREGASSEETLEVFRLEPLRRFEGRVLEADGSPAAGELEVVVTAWLPNDTRATSLSIRQASFPAPPPEFIAHLAGEGRFGPLLVPRAALLTVHVRDPLTHFEGDPVLLAGVGPLEATDIFLPQRATVRPTRHSARGRLAPIRGRVVRADGKPVADADVAWYLGPHGASFDHSTRTLLDGSFTLGGVLAEHGTGRIRVRWHGPSVNPFAESAPPRSEGEGPRTRMSMYVSNGADSPFAVVDSVRPGSEVEIVVPEICVGLLDVHVEGGEGESAMAWLARHDGRKPEASGEQWSAPIALGPKVLLSRHALEPGRYRVLVEQSPGAAWAAEADVTVEAGCSTRVDLTLARTGILELRPPPGYPRLTVVELLRGDVPLARLWMNPVVPTPLALAEGELTVEWELPMGAPHRRTVQIIPGETVSVAVGI